MKSISEVLDIVSTPTGAFTVEEAVLILRRIAAVVTDSAEPLPDHLPHAETASDFHTASRLDAARFSPSSPGTAADKAGQAVS